jgi:hypothetical protein
MHIKIVKLNQSFVMYLVMSTPSVQHLRSSTMYVSVEPGDTSLEVLTPAILDLDYRSMTGTLMFGK